MVTLHPDSGRATIWNGGGGGLAQPRSGSTPPPEFKERSRKCSCLAYSIIAPSALSLFYQNNH